MYYSHERSHSKPLQLLRRTTDSRMGLAEIELGLNDVYYTIFFFVFEKII